MYRFSDARPWHERRGPQEEVHTVPFVSFDYSLFGMLCTYFGTPPIDWTAARGAYLRRRLARKRHSCIPQYTVIQIVIDIRLAGMNLESVFDDS